MVEMLGLFYKIIKLKPDCEWDIRHYKSKDKIYSEVLFKSFIGYHSYK